MNPGPALSTLPLQSEVGTTTERTPPHGKAPVRTRLTNLDSVQQAAIWRELGPTEALERTCAMIRSALLLSDQLIVDRNQLLDGVCLLALGPEGLRWHLGLPPHSPLPLTVTCSSQRESGLIDVDEQVASVTHDDFVSSAAAALLTEHDHANHLDWLLPAPRPTDVDAAGHLHHGLRPPGPAGAGENVTGALARMRREWADEMRRGAVDMVPWRPTDVSTQLARNVGLVQGDHPLSAALLNASEGNATRSQVLHFLASSREEFGDDECRAAFLWWTQAYYDAICAANGEYRISFGDAVPRSTSTALAFVQAQRHQEWGVATPPRSAWQRMAARVSFRRLQPDELVPLEGEIVDHMRRISPQDFRRLLRSEPLQAGAFWKEPSNRRMYNLSLAVRRTVTMNSEQRSRLVVLRTVQFLLVLTAAVLLGLRDVGMLPAQGTGWVWYWAGLAFLGAFPWDLVKELFSLSPVTMTGTIRIGDAP